MGVSRRSRVPERITRPDERFDSSQVDQRVLYCERLGGRSYSKKMDFEGYVSSLAHNSK